MRSNRWAGLVGSLVLCAIAAAPLVAQSVFGYPLKGSWSGYWTVAGSNDKVRLLLEFDWDGENPKGTLSPGINPTPLKNLKLDPPSGGVQNAMTPWALHFEADAKGANGASERLVVDGKLSNIGSPHKRIAGTWTQGSRKGPFEVRSN